MRTSIPSLTRVFLLWAFGLLLPTMALADFVRTTGADLPYSYGGEFKAAGSVVFFLQDGSLYRSADEGATWSTTKTGGLDSAVHSVSAPGRITLAAYHSGALYRSLDSGATWSRLSDGRGLWQIWDIEAIADTFFILADYPSGFAHAAVVRSADGGNTWDTVYHSSSEGTDLIHIGNKVVASLSFGMARSKDGGRNWDPLAPPEDYLDYMISAGGLLLGYCFQKNSWRSDDSGATWKQFPGNSTTGILSRFASVGNVILAQGVKGIFSTIDAGRTWQPLNKGLPPTIWYGVGASPHFLFVVANESIWRCPVEDVKGSSLSVRRVRVGNPELRAGTIPGRFAYPEGRTGRVRIWTLSGALLGNGP